MLKKIWILPLLLLVCLIPFVSAQAASKPEITNVRTATRTDANTPFVRTVLDVNGKANPKLYIDNSGEYVFVTLPNTGVGKNVAKSYKPNSNVISRVTLSPRSSSTDVTIKVPRAVTKNDVKVFTLPGATNSKASSRVVIDINDKSGKLKQWSHWGDTNIGIKGATKPSQSWKPSATMWMPSSTGLPERLVTARETPSMAPERRNLSQMIFMFSLFLLVEWLGRRELPFGRSQRMTALF